MPKPKSFPKCCAPGCPVDADHRVYARGDNGEFRGELCDGHYAMLEMCFPANLWQVAYLRIIGREALEAALAAQPE